MTAHGTNTDAQTVDRDAARAAESRLAQDLVALRAALPLLLGLTVVHRHIDPGNQAASQGRIAEVLLRKGIRADGFGHLAIDIEDGRRRISQQIGDRGVNGAHLRNQLTHVLCASARSRLVGHCRHPLDQVVLEQATQAHQHQGHRAIAADPVLAALGKRILDHMHVDRVKNDHRIISHAQRRRRIDPVAIPAGCTQLRVHLLGVITALAGNDDLASLERINAHCILQGQCSFLATEHRCLAPCGRGREIHRLDMGEVTFIHHALHQHRAYHPTPANQTHSLHHVTSNQ
ncbi:hypothetical protein SDC9_142696 [bioreactor metagenome]|uniref:Uncharacterized protein n=1 Tax=bioreactor metagenome TaxID=1076179 RepID=A0A645E1V1_9ZZZZ